jgi:spermidine synthase
MSLEMTAGRAMQPYFGSTTWVWTHIIAVVLAALAGGYALGGALADRRPSRALFFGLMGAGGVLAAISALAVGPVSRLFLVEGLDLEGIASVLRTGSFGTTLIVFAPPCFLMGTVSPLAVRLLSDDGVGRAAGRVMAVSTVGSILGTYLPVTLLVPHFGSRGSLLFSAAMLVVPAAVGLLSTRRRAGAAVVVLFAAGVSFAATRSDVVREAPSLPWGGTAVVLEETESPYQYLSVRDDTTDDGTVNRILTINEGVYTYHSLKVKGRVLTESRYYDDYSLLPLLLDLPQGSELRACIIGFACGVNAGQWRHFWEGPYRLQIDGPELDPAILELGRRWFDLPPDGMPGLRTFAADGRPFLAALGADARYHVLVVDAFANELYIPFHLGTREFFELCKRRLEPGGLLAMNVYAVGAQAPNLAALEHTLATVFGRCLRVSQYWGSNFLLLARNGDAPPNLALLDPESARKRFGARPELAEWDRLLNLGAAFPGNALLVEPRADGLLLTDDHAPLEWLTDRFLDGIEERALAR